MNLFSNVCKYMQCTNLLNTSIPVQGGYQ